MSYTYSVQELLDLEKSPSSSSSSKLDQVTIDLLQQIHQALTTSKRSKTQPNWESLRTKPAVKRAGGGGGAPAAPPPSSPTDIVRSTLNKLSEASYLDNLETLLSTLRSNPTQTQPLHELMFDICSTNRFFSKLYADVYTAVLAEMPPLQLMFLDKMPIVLDLFDHLFQLNLDEEENYEEFCARGEINENKRSMAQFCLHMNENGVLEDLYVIQFCQLLLEKILELIPLENYTQSIDIAVEILTILYNPKKMQKVSVRGQRVGFNEKIKSLARSKKSQFSSLTTRSLFKLMDLAAKA